MASIFSKFGASVLKKAKFLTKNLSLEKFSINSNQKTRIEQLRNPGLSFEMKSITLQLTS